MATLEDLKAKRAELRKTLGKIASLVKEKRELVKQLKHLALMKTGLEAEVEGLTRKLFDE
jgi:hypothetical protein